MAASDDLSTGVLSFIENQFTRQFPTNNTTTTTTPPTSSEAASFEAAMLSRLQLLLTTPDSSSSSRWQTIPELHQLSRSQWCDGMLVRFRCMVRDMYDPEYYPRVFVVNRGGTGSGTDTGAGGRRMVSGLFRDVVQCGDGEQLGEVGTGCLGQRHTLHCCTPPWLTPWSRTLLYTPSTVSETQRDSVETDRNGVATGKRSLEDDDSEMDTCDAGSPATTEASNTTDTISPTTAKRLNTGQSGEATTAPSVGVNNSLGNDPDALSCLVKLYDDSHTLLMNQLVEFVGVLSMHPALSGENMVPIGGGDAEIGATGDCQTVDSAETLAHHPPASRVPRLHAIAWRQLRHYTSQLSPPTADLAAARDQLLQLLITAAAGDQLVGELLLCHLVSSVYTRRDSMPLGQLSLNISNVSAAAGGSECAEFVELFVKLLAELVERLCVLTASRQRLNSAVLVPSKDYSTNTLKPALLQMADTTHLVIDETALTEGQLEPRGVANVTALGSLLRHQTVNYDFNFHQLAFNADIPTLVLSLGPSLLPTDLKLPLTPPEIPDSGDSASRLRAQFAALHEYLTPVLLQQLRSYMFAVRRLDYSVPEQLQTRVQQDFVNWRQTSSESAVPGSRPDGDHLHRALVLARLLTVSRGDTALTETQWLKAVELLRQVKLRQASTAH